MKRSLHALLCAAVLSLAACIPVDDFGSQWDKGTADAALVGTWDDILSEGQKPKEGGGVVIVCAETHCTLDSLNASERLKADYKSMTLRTLAAGDFKFVMVREEGKTTGDIVRYSIADGVFRQSSPRPAKTGEFLKAKHPAAKNIHRPPCEAGSCMFDSIEIKTLDEETVKILSEIPDTAEYWVTEDRYRKRP